MAKIEEGLHGHHASIQSSSIQSTPGISSGISSGRVMGESSLDSSKIPFAKVTSVAAGSPAEEAGLKLGDMIRTFGEVNWSSDEKLSKVAEVVRVNQGVRNLCDV